MNAVKPRRGFRFTHRTLLDTQWKPGPGQTWRKDAPLAECVVTSVRGESVYFTYASAYDAGVHRGGFRWDRNAFVRHYMSEEN